MSGGAAALDAENAVPLDGHEYLVAGAEPYLIPQVDWEHESSTVVEACRPTGALHVGYRS